MRISQQKVSKKNHDKVLNTRLDKYIFSSCFALCLSLGIWSSSNRTPNLPPVCFSFAALSLTYGLIKDDFEKAKIDGKIGNCNWMLAGSSAGFLIFFLTLSHVFSSQIQIESEPSLKNLIAVNKESGEIEKVKISAIGANNEVFAEDKIEEPSNNKGLYNDLTISTEKGAISVKAKSNLGNDNNLKLGSLNEKEDLNNNGYYDIKNDDSLINGIEELYDRTGGKSETLKKIREGCILYTEKFCSFPFHNVNIYVPDDRIPKGQVAVCKNSKFWEYRNYPLLVSFRGKDNQLKNPVPLVIGPQIPAHGCYSDKNKIQINPEDKDKLLKDLSHQEIKDFKNGKYGYKGIANIEPSEIRK